MPNFYMKYETENFINEVFFAENLHDESRDYFLTAGDAFTYIKLKAEDFNLAEITNPMEQIAGKFIIKRSPSNTLIVTPIGQDVNYLKAKRMSEFLPLVSSAQKLVTVKFGNLSVQDTLEATHEVFLRKKNNGDMFSYHIFNQNITIKNIPVALAAVACSQIEMYRTNLKWYKERYVDIINNLQTAEELINLTFGSMLIEGTPFNGSTDFILDFTPVNGMTNGVSVAGMLVVNTSTGEPL